MEKISGVIITYNEEKKIIPTLEALAGLVDEILIVDSFSTDRTPELCISFPKVRFLQRKFTNYGDQKQYAIEQAKNDWIISVDADEVISEELASSIRKIIPELSEDCSYEFRRLDNFCGKWMRNGGFVPVYKERLIHRKVSRMEGDVHEVFVHNRPVQMIRLEGFLYHYSITTVSEHLELMEKYSTLAAEMMFQKGKRVVYPMIYLKALFRFCRMYFVQFGFIDGRMGFVMALNTAYYVYLKYLKLYLKIHQEKK